ncbi:MAG: hypothetical protein IJ664_07525 [Clostridia bacterium]|nr:hypothetical protein [Clostridia bacterium]
MNRAKRFLRRWKTEYDFKTFLSASGSLAVTAVFAVYNGYLGIRHSALWYGAICVYYIVLVLLRGMIVVAEKRVVPGETQEASRDKVCLMASFLLLFLNISLILPVSMMVRQQKPVNLTLIPAIAMAAHTTYKIIMASINLRRRKASSNSLVWLLRTISFIDALVSILTLQNTLIMVNSEDGALKMLPLTAITSAIVWVAVLLLSVHAIIRGIKRSKKG